LETNKTWKCAKCDRELVVKKTLFSYLGHTFSHEVLRCPKCGNVFIPKELAEGRMAEVETQMEDK
jgi:DNA-directed RNA polymerase subunit RPC12/RpoP